ncbi:His-Xaa-Ser system radical SAM maturase HxsB [Cytophaga sp. FL35]|uniref:His-Xaa-Ser system radical SAM maturase HxsB n=1 Tax=Cytophaga sp. FL35 TaxID=1904456 RepID=UPI0016536FE1|nr:His-Xaa-Ser system radical SAM maturase HxsB [Cytophaga sp. FL35]MBC7000607.1 His-Xaa-Ser system radical SAM maturase HxsB [Cytophaga sp. FL35]
MENIRNKRNRKFRTREYYGNSASDYHLLPFRFIELSESKEILVNEVGESLIVPRGTALKIAQRCIAENDPIIPDLISRFFISRKPIPELIDVLATRYRTKKSFLDSFTSLHIFVLTLRCNHSCHYCQVSRVTENREDFDISYNDIDLGIDHMFKSPSKKLTIEFQGGEPLLAFDKLEYAIERITRLNKDFKKELSFVVCTNATVFNTKNLQFLKEHNVLISTSLDGPEFLHDANRPKTGRNSYQLVLNGINYARKMVGHDQVSALMTTTRLSLDYPIEIIDNYLENGFNNIFLRPISPYGFALKNKTKNIYDDKKFLEFYKKGLDHIIKINQRGRYFVEDYTAILLKKILTPFCTNYVDLQSPSGIINNVVVFNYDGRVYASDESRMLAERNDLTFLLGHVSDSYESIFYGKKSKELSKYWSNESLAGCSDCAFQSYCGADPVYHYASQGDFEGFRPTSGFCLKNMGIIKHLFELMDFRKEEVMPIFISWISN